MFNAFCSRLLLLEVFMIRYIIRRVLQATPLLFLLSIFMFTLLHLLPGGPEQVLFNSHLSAAGRTAMRVRFGLLAQYVFGVRLHWLPASGTETLGYTLSPFDAFIDHLQHLILPMLVLALSFVAGWNRYIRSSMIEIVKQDYMRTAHAKGVG